MVKISVCYCHCHHDDFAKSTYYYNIISYVSTRLHAAIGIVKEQEMLSNISELNFDWQHRSVVITIQKKLRYKQALLNMTMILQNIH